MRIAYVGAVPPIRGGVSQYGGALVAALRNEGMQVDVWTWRHHYPRLLYRRPQEDPAAVGPPGAVRALSWWNPWSWFRTGLRCRAADTIVFPWVTPVHAVAYWTVLAVARRPSLVVIHNATPHERFPLSRPLTGLVFRRVTGAVAHARAIAADAAGLAPELSVDVVRMPSMLPIRPTPMPPWPPVRLLFLGFQRHYKGIDLAIEGLAKARAAGRDVVLTIAGEPWNDGDDVTELITATRQAGVIEMIPRYVSDAEVDRLLADHHALIAPYRSATQSAVVPLAHAAGRPAIVTDVGGLAELVEDGIDGVVAGEATPAAVGDAIVTLVDELDALATGVASPIDEWRPVVEIVAALSTVR